MAVSLDINTNNEFNIHHVASDSKIKLFYKNPTTEEIVQFDSAMTNMIVQKKSIEEIYNTKIEWGLKFIEGFRSGDFEVENKPISSNPMDENYYKNWKNEIKNKAGKIVLVFVNVVFGETCYAIKPEAPSADFFSKNIAHS